jgi:hypothetical protein
MEETNRGTSLWIKYIAVVQTIVLAMFCWGIVRTESAARDYEAKSKAYQARSDEWNKRAEEYKQRVADYEKVMERYKPKTETPQP